VVDNRAHRATPCSQPISGHLNSYV